MSISKTEVEVKIVCDYWADNQLFMPQEKFSVAVMLKYPNETWHNTIRRYKDLERTSRHFFKVYNEKDEDYIELFLEHDGIHMQLRKSKDKLIQERSQHAIEKLEMRKMLTMEQDKNTKIMGALKAKRDAEIEFNSLFE